MTYERAAEWQRLTEYYREAFDGELLNLAADSANLTEVARLALREEMKRRGLSESDEAAKSAHSRSFSLEDSDSGPADGDGAEEEGDSGADYTWKTSLCECGTAEGAQQVRTTLAAAGIESWLRRQALLGASEVMVAADQLEEARVILSQQISPEILEASKIEEPEFVPPVCPQCRTADPVLEGADPVNSWLCEACGHQWADAEQAPE
jgi:ribosomal protein L37AE/L43A